MSQIAAGRFIVVGSTVTRIHDSILPRTDFFVEIVDEVQALNQNRLLDVIRYKGVVGKEFLADIFITERLLVKTKR